jgi:hypothetical protein
MSLLAGPSPNLLCAAPSTPLSERSKISSRVERTSSSLPLSTSSTVSPTSNPSKTSLSVPSVSPRLSLTTLLSVRAKIRKISGFSAMVSRAFSIKPGVDSDREAQKIGKLCQDRDVGPEVLDLKVDPVDLEFGDVEQHVWLLAVGFFSNSECFFGVVGVLLGTLLRHGLPPSPNAPVGS